MGYAPTTILVWGVNLTPEQSAVLARHLNDDGDCIWDVVPADRVFHRKGGEKPHRTFVQQHPITPYPGHDTSGIGHVVFDADLRSHGTDSRIHSRFYQKGFPHTAGIYIASNGYALSDDLSQFMPAVPPEAAANFEDFIKPVLASLGLPTEPGLRAVTQVW